MAANVTSGQIQSLTAENLTGIRGQRVLFRDLSFRIAAETVLSLEGPNGSGKTSLLRMVAGFLAPAAGTIALDGVRDPDERGKHIGWLGHQDAAKPQLTPREVLTFFARLCGVPDDGVDAALERMGLVGIAALPCQYLSAGQKKRLALARLALLRRPLWLLDEPLSSLDADGRKCATDLIAEHVRRGGIAVAATHEPLDIASERLVLGAGP